MVLDDDKHINMKKYEFMLYLHITQQIESGTLHLPNSTAFCSLQSHLISDEKWQNKEPDFKRIGLSKVTDTN